jgi:hypothetical protein
VLGPLLIGYLRQYQLDHGVPLRNLLVRPVAAKNYMTPAQLAQLDAEQHGTPSPGWLVTAAWLAVSIPIVWRVWVALQKAVILFGL